MSDNETPSPVASLEGEQPTEQAVAPAIETTEAPATIDSAVTTAPKLYAGKYKSVEELEEGYRNTNAESSRMASLIQERMASPQPAAPVSAPATTYSAEQLETWKEGRIREVAQNEAIAARLQGENDYAGAQKYQTAAQESARQVRMIDKELRSIDIKEAMSAGTRQTAEHQLMSQASTVLQTYKADLVQGTPLYAKASEFLQAYGQMGHNTNSAVTQAQAVAMAAQVLGLGAKQAATNSRKEMLNDINTNLRAGVVTAPAKAGKSASEPDFNRMTDKEFAAYKQQRGWD